MKAAPLVSVPVTAGGSEELVKSTPPCPGLLQWKKRLSVWFSYVCFLISLIPLHYTQPVTMINTAMEMLKKNIIHFFHVFEKNPHILK